MNRTITRRLAPASLLAAMALIVAQPAFAVVIPEGVACPGFALKFEASEGRVRIITFKDKEGQLARVLTVATGVVITYKNVATGESIRFKTSGSVNRTVTEGNTQTVTATGHNGLILFPTDVPAGPTTTQYSGGRIVYTINTKTGVFTLVSASGNATDVCAALA